MSEKYIKKLDISSMDKVLEIFLTIHNENFEKKVENKYFQDIFLNEYYEIYTLNEVHKSNQNIEQIIGYIIFYDTLDCVDLFEISVKNKSQNKGLGHKLLNESIEMLFNEEKYKKRNEEFKKILLEVNENNINAVKLYEKNNFKKIAIRKNYYGNNQNGIIMEKVIIM